jgi:Fe-S cluster assembly iron-binding protein IscA
MTGPHGQELGTPPLLDEGELTAHLARNREAIRNGTALFNGIPVNLETEITRYEQVTAGLFAYKWEYSRFYVYGQEPPGSLPRDFILHSLLWGWWSFPWGPVRTLRAIITNLRGGRRRRVIDLIGDDRPHRNDVVILTERAAEAARRHMAEHGFPTGSAIRVDVTGKLRPRRYEITYDELPTTEGRDWIGQSHGVSILVFKKDAPRLEGLTIDFQAGRYTFDESTLTSLD